ncbi:MAG TPA: polysaccharide biosynthesis/export family protein [Polyangia bacterium]|nr:polysaccharide biosynthesis/export family protein [Polyangia bacterium]
MRHRGLLVLSLLLPVLASGLGCGHSHLRYDYASEPDPRKQEYVIGPSDVLKISVWHNADLSVDTTVRPDGTITLPLIGDIRAAGRTSEQIRVELTQRLGAFIKDESAIATVAVTGINSYRFTVSGNVEHQGTFTSNHYVTVLEAITLAGGPNRFAAPEDTILTRTEGKRGRRRIPIDYPDLVNGTRPEEDLPLISGDTIYVP